jgi:pilus assembly protein CpaE
MNIFVCDPNQDYARFVAALALPLEGQVVRYVSGIEDLTSAAGGEPAFTAVFGPGCPVEAAAAWTLRNRNEGRGFSAILLTASETADLVKQAWKAGIDEVCEVSASGEVQRAALAEMVRLAEERSRTGRTSENGKAPARVISVFSTKGGVGKTVLATNLGVALARLGKSTVLVDLDLQFGDVGIMLGVEPTRTMFGAMQAGDRLDREMLQGFLTQHSSGLSILLAPIRPEEAESVTPGRIARVLDALSAMFEFVVIDTAASFDDVVLTALDASDRVIAVTMMDVASVKNTRISLQKLKQLGYDDSLVEVLLNRADSKVFLEPDEVEKAIGSKIRYRLPSDQIVPRSVNKGRPVITEAPKSAIAKTIIEIATHLTQAEAEQKAVLAHVS